MLAFLIQNRRWLGTGLLLTFASAFGQTWFISLFAGEIKSHYALSDGQWGGIYTLATLSSAVILVLRGSLADTMALSRLAPLIATLFAGAALLMAFGNSIFLLGAGVFLLRFCGQGMFTHIAMTAMGRWFVATRGRAISITALGFPLGEALLPLPTVLLIGWLGWRGGWMVVACVLIAVVAPALYLLLRSDRDPAGRAQQSGSPGLGGKHWRRREVLGHWLFPTVVPILLTPGFIGTVVFFHQVHVADIKGWTLAQMAPAYPAYAAVTVVTALVTGALVDRLGPTRILPFLLIPLGVAMLLLGMVTQVWGWIGILAIMALTQGMAGSFWGAFLPSVYGTDNLGSVRAITVAIGVISTAIGPGLTGLAIDLGVNFPDQGLALGLWCFALVPLCFFVKIKVEREMRAQD